jgi:hypothetical protein
MSAGLSMTADLPKQPFYDWGTAGGIERLTAIERPTTVKRPSNEEPYGTTGEL